MKGVHSEGRRRRLGQGCCTTSKPRHATTNGPDHTLTSSEHRAIAYYCRLPSFCPGGGTEVSLLASQETLLVNGVARPIMITTVMMRRPGLSASRDVIAILRS